VTMFHQQIGLRFRILIGVALTVALLFWLAWRLPATARMQRTFGAPSTRVWAVWTDADLMKNWWGPRNFTAPFIKNDFRVGGTYLWSMKSSKGEMFWNTGVFKEITPNRRIVSTISFSDANGRAIPGSQAPVPGRWPDEITVVVEFTELNGKTSVAVTEVGIPFIVMPLSKIAWAEQFDKIQALLAQKEISVDQL
jgi:uncharacterized protein YndB with AHSA1/START domain